MDAGSIIADAIPKPILVHSILVKGHSATSDSLLNTLTEPLLKASNLGDVLVGVRNVALTMKKLDIFDSVDITLDSTSPGSLDILYTVKEKKRFVAQTGLSAGNYEGSMNVSGTIGNAFGNAEKVSVVMSSGINTNDPLFGSDSLSMKAHQSFALDYTQPINGDPDTVLNGSLYQQEKDHSLFLSCQEKARGVSVGLRVYSNDGRNHLDVGFIQLDTVSSGVTCIRLQKKHPCLETSIIDTRDDPILPTQGTYFKASQELSGLGGNVAFFKSEVDLQHSLPLTSEISLTGSVRGGTMVPIQKVSSIDKFFLGGALSIRGFRQYGLGPRDGPDSIGGDTFWSSSLSLLFPLPLFRFKPIKGHLFVNGGSLLNLNRTSGVGEMSRQVFGSPSVACGLGLAAQFTAFRLEFNYLVPLVVHSSDLVYPRFQLGIGMHFM